MTRVGVLGAGGVGSAVAGHLARAGADVVLVGRGSPHVHEVDRAGLTVHPPGAAPWTVAVDTATTAADLAADSLDLLLVLTKSFDTAAAVRSVAHALRADAVVASPQNGLGTDAVLAEAVGADRALVGVTTVGATLRDPGHVSVSGATAAGESLTHVGVTALARGVSRAEQLVDLLSAADLPASVSPDIEARIWEKLALASMAPVGAVLQRSVGDVWEAAQGRRLVRGLFDETLAVAASRGVALDSRSAWGHASTVYAGTGDHHTSLATDVALGRRTELSSMAGAVQVLGRERDVPVPVHDTVLALLDVLGARR